MSDIYLTRHNADIRPEQPWFVLNAAQHYSLMGSENAAISHFYSFDVAQSAPQTLAIPDGCIDIVFDCDASRPTARVCGTTLAARSAEFKPGHHYFGVRFQPGMMPDSLDLIPEDLTDSEFGFLEVIPGARQLFEHIVQSSSFSRQMALFNAHFTARAIRKSSAVTSLVIRTIHQQRGNVRIEQLAAQTGYTSRTLQRQFRQDTGMSPKLFSRIVRCQSALNAIHPLSGSASMTQR